MTTNELLAARQDMHAGTSHKMGGAARHAVGDRKFPHWSTHFFEHGCCITFVLTLHEATSVEKTPQMIDSSTFQSITERHHTRRKRPMIMWLHKPWLNAHPKWDYKLFSLHSSIYQTVSRTHDLPKHTSKDQQAKTKDTLSAAQLFAFRQLFSR